MWYILDKNNNPIKANVLTAYKWMEYNPKRRIVKQDHIKDKLDNEVFVSTVFLGLDHSYWKDLQIVKPTLWETMIFGGEHDQSYQERYSSYEDAFEGHQKALNLINQI
jgi:hypothetical protein